jgi:2-dehydro-3-deoxyphosphogluconate aldolase/(4S)-4-hydroxy-2-oxoglutarate aldolase
MEVNEIYARIGSLCVVPVIAIENPDAALPLADALLEGGLPIAEITFRTAAAAAVIEKIAKQRPGILLGAGTLLNIENLRRAAECGATLGVAPGFNPDIVCEALKIGFPFSPGIMTPSDIEGALSLGAKVLKFFPAGAAGGVKMLRSISAPYAHLGVRFLPTGGIHPNNMKEYLEEKSVLAVGGTWVATREDIAAARWNTIRDNCRSALTAVEQLKDATHEGVKFHGTGS